MSLRTSPSASKLTNLEDEPLSKSYRDEDTAYDPGKASLWCKATWRARFSGWRGGVVVAIAIATLVLLLNIIMAIVAAVGWMPADGIATAYTGDCAVAARWTTAIHLLINLLSSLLLGASNYCMQRLVAPTRKEIDSAHAQKKWLDIGVPSVRNLTLISKARMALWVLLVLSSVPLHFLYNSVVFETLAANDVDFLVVAPEFFTVKHSWSPLMFNSTGDNYITRLQETVLDDKYLDRSVFENITGAECLQRYSASFITGGGTVFAVPVPDFLAMRGMNASDSLSWATSGSGEIVSEVDYSYCLSQIVPSKCQVQFSLTILYVVIASNILKILVMILILWRLNQETVVTVGDAIKSFLQLPDTTTEDCCLMSRRNVDRVWKVPAVRSSQRFQPKHRESWFGACSTRRWIVSLFSYAVVITLAGWLYSLAAIQGEEYGRNGFGRVNVNYLIDVFLPGGQTSIIPYVLLANLPQAVISFLYLTYNGLFTCMLANREWSQYSVKRATLRVTLPSGTQRSTYFLQLPYSFSVPLLLASVLLHWFVSQSIFLARVAVYKDGTLVTMADRLGMYKHLSKSGNGVFSGVGYSNTALVASIVWGSVLVATCLLVAGICTYPKGLPIGGTNSAVISAACHVKYEDEAVEKGGEDIAKRPLKWGVTIAGGREQIGHCCFSSDEVEDPKVGFLYAGARVRAKDA